MGMMNVSLTTGPANQEFISTSGKMFEQKTSDNAQMRTQTAQTAISEEITLTTAPQMSVLRASTQITLNNSLKETLKYLRTHANDKKREHVFGELWKVLNITNDESEDNPYNGELIDFQIDEKAKNIFAAQ